MLTGDKDVLLISFEQLEPGFLPINPDECVLTFCCPCCHAFKPILMACKVPLLTRKDDSSPICMEMKECHILECEHRACHLCWSSCQQMAIYGSIQCEDLEHAERYQLFKKKQTWVGRHGAATQFTTIFAEISKEAREGKQGLTHLKGSSWQSILLCGHLMMEWGSTTSSCHSLDSRQFFR